jgi:hypothetical protein
MIERELERVAHVVADHCGRAAECRDEADLDRVARKSWIRERQHCCACQPESRPHGLPLPHVRECARDGACSPRLAVLALHFLCRATVFLDNDALGALSCTIIREIGNWQELYCRRTAASRHPNLHALIVFKVLLIW